jgi:hypothetical protein
VRASRGIQLVVLNQPWTEPGPHRVDPPLSSYFPFPPVPTPSPPPNPPAFTAADIHPGMLCKDFAETCSSGHGRLSRAAFVGFSPSTRQLYRPLPFPVFVSKPTFGPQKRSTCALQMMMTHSHTKPKLYCVHAPPRPLNKAWVHIPVPPEKFSCDVSPSLISFFPPSPLFPPPPLTPCPS